MLQPPDGCQAAWQGLDGQPARGEYRALMLHSCPPGILDLLLKSLILRRKSKWPLFQVSSLSTRNSFHSLLVQELLVTIKEEEGDDGLGVGTNPILLAPVLEWSFHPVSLMSWVLFCQAYMLEDENKTQQNSIQIA